MTRTVEAAYAGRRVWSLLEIMKEFSVTSLLMMHGIADAYERFPETERPKMQAMLDDLFGRRDPSWHSTKKITDADRAQLEAVYRHWADECGALGLAASDATIRRMLNELKKDGCKYGDVWRHGGELRGRLRDDLDGKFFLSLNMPEAALYAQPRRGWEEIVKRFPAATTDIDEMSKCFALGRYAAAVFHSVQVVEVGLAELCEALGSKDPHSGWTAAAKALERVINKKHQDRTDFERKHFAFFEQVQGTVEGLKNAWRNKISHAQGRLAVLTPDFTPDATEEIILASRAFMRRLATEGPTAQATILEFPGQERREAKE